MENKKTKLTISGNVKSIKNIEKAKTQGKNSVIIENKLERYNVIIFLKIAYFFLLLLNQVSFFLLFWDL